MTYTPNATVIVGGEEFTSDVINNVIIGYGRNSIWEQPRASYAQIEIYTPAGVPLAIDITDDITVDIDLSNAVTSQRIFTGEVTSIESKVQASGSVGQVCVHTISAIGPFAKMSRVLTGSSSMPKEYDDDRLDRIITASGVTKDVIDTPGVYEFHTRAAGVSDCYSLAAEFAGQIFGYIYETATGTVGYANESRRLNTVQDDGYYQIDNSYILWRGIESKIDRANLLNDLILSYKDNATKTANSAGSIAAYGTTSGVISTNLEQGSEAQTLADRYIALRATPLRSLSAFSIAVDSPNLTSADRDALIGVYLGYPFEITNLPIPVYNGTYQGFVEGWRWQINRSQAILSINSTIATLSITPTRWQDVSAATKWSDVSAAIQWPAYE
jgi:hypothetical protein